MLTSGDDALPGVLELFLQAEEQNGFAKVAGTVEEREWHYGQKCDLLVGGTLLHGEEMEVSRDRGLISFGVTDLRGKRHRLHVPRQVLARHIRGNGYNPIVRSALCKMFGIKQEQRPRDKRPDISRRWSH